MNYSGNYTLLAWARTDMKQFAWMLPNMAANLARWMHISGNQDNVKVLKCITEETQFYKNSFYKFLHLMNKSKYCHRCLWFSVLHNLERLKSTSAAKKAVVTCIKELQHYEILSNFLIFHHKDSILKIFGYDLQHLGALKPPLFTIKWVLTSCSKCKSEMCQCEAHGLGGWQIAAIFSSSTICLSMLMSWCLACCHREILEKLPSYWCTISGMGPLPDHFWRVRPSRNIFTLLHCLLTWQTNWKKTLACLSREWHTVWQITISNEAIVQPDNIASKLTAYL